VWHDESSIFFIRLNAITLNFPFYFWLKEKYLSIFCEVSRQKVKLSNERWFFEVPYQAKEGNEASHKRLAMPFKEEEESTTPNHLMLAKFDWGTKHLLHTNLKTMQIS
jgi:hypothetical protein